MPVVSRGLLDSDGQVRRLCLESLRRAGSLLDGFISDVTAWKRQQPQGREAEFVLVVGRKPSAEEQALIEVYAKSVADENGLLLPVAKALADAIPALARAVSDPDANVARLACETLETMPSGCRRLLARAAEVAPFVKKDAIKKDDPLGPASARSCPPSPN